LTKLIKTVIYAIFLTSTCCNIERLASRSGEIVEPRRLFENWSRSVGLVRLLFSSSFLDAKSDVGSKWRLDDRSLLRCQL